MTQPTARILARLVNMLQENAEALEGLRQTRLVRRDDSPEVSFLTRDISRREITDRELQAELAWLQETVEPPAGNLLETVMHIPLSFAAQWLPRAAGLTVFGHPMMSLNKQELLAFAAASVYDTQILKQQVAELQLAVGAKPRIILPH